MKLSCYLQNCDCCTLHFVINSSAPRDSSTDREEGNTGVEKWDVGAGKRGRECPGLYPEWLLLIRSNHW